MSPTVPWGTHVEFVRRYETYILHAFLGTGGRHNLAESIGSSIRSRGATRLLDCAAGTGFPALDLIETSTDLGLDTIHVCDGDPVMVRELIRRAKECRIDPAALNPRQRQARTPRQALDDLVINWRDLRVVRDTYDYVMCRGNSLVYADTWTGLDRVSSLEGIRHHLSNMADRVEVGGHLHIDAPWKLTPKKGPVQVVDTPRLRITEQITDSDDHREWLLEFTHIDAEHRETTLSFRRVSSRLTIHDMGNELERLEAFEDTEPFQMDAERVVFGTIIARKVR